MATYTKIQVVDLGAAMAGAETTGMSISVEDADGDVLLEPGDPSISIVEDVGGGGIFVATFLADDAWPADVIFRFYADDTVFFTTTFSAAAAALVATQARCPVGPDGAVHLVAGDEYSTDTTGPLQWVFQDWTGAAPASASLELTPRATFRSDAGGAGTTFSGTATLTGTTLVVLVPLTAAQTAALATSPPQRAGNYRVQLRLVFTGSKPVTLVDTWGNVRR